MARKWFQLVGEDGKALTSADAVVVDIEDVVTLRDAVKDKHKDSHLAGIAASDLTVFANRAAYDAKQALEEDAPIGSFGGSKENAIIVQVPQKADSGMSMTQLWENYFSAYVASSVSFVTSLIASDTSQSSNIQAAKKKV